MLFTIITRITLTIVLLSSALVIQAAEPDPHGQAIVMALQNRDAAQFLQLIDSKALGKRVVAALGLPAAQQAQFMEGMQIGIAKIPDAMMQQFERTDPKLKLVRTSAEQEYRRHLVRLDMMSKDGGIDYIHFDTGADGRIVDWYSYSQGNSASALMTQRALTMLGDGRLLGKALAGDNFEPVHLAAYNRFNDYMLAGKFALAYVAMEQLPESFRKTQDWAALRVRLAGQMDNVTYREALDVLATRFSHVPELQFLLVDHFFLQQKYDEAIRAITAFEQYVGEDGATNFLKCTIHIEQKAYSEATQACQRGVDVEPEFENLYWMLVTIGMDTEQPNLALTALGQYEAAFQKQFDPDGLAALPEYRELARTAEFQRWAEQRRAHDSYDESLEATEQDPQ